MKSIWSCLGICLFFSLNLSASAQPPLDEKGWRWKDPDQRIPSSRQYQLSSVPDITIYPDPSHRGDYAVAGAENFFSDINHGLNVYARVRRICTLGRLGEQTLTGPVSMKTYEGLVKQLAKAGGDQAGVPIPTSVHDVFLNYLRFEGWVADRIVAAGDRLGRRAKQKWMILDGELKLQTFEWTCAEIEVRTKDGWVPGGYRMKTPVKPLALKSTRKQIPNVSGEMKYLKQAVFKLELWARQRKNRQPELREKFLQHKENPCIHGLCSHPQTEQLIVAFEDTITESGSPQAPPPLDLGHQQQHQRIHDLTRIRDWSKKDLTLAEGGLEQWHLLHKPSNPETAKQLEQARREQTQAKLALDGVKMNRDSATDYPRALGKAQDRLTRAESAVRKLEKELSNELTEVDKLNLSRLRRKVEDAQKKLARDEQKLKEAQSGHEGCKIETDSGVMKWEPQRFDIQP